LGYYLGEVLVPGSLAHRFASSGPAVVALLLLREPGKWKLRLDPEASTAVPDLLFPWSSKGRRGMNSDGKSGQAPPSVCSVPAGKGEVVITTCLAFFLAGRRKRVHLSGLWRNRRIERKVMSLYIFIASKRGKAWALKADTEYLSHKLLVILVNHVILAILKPHQ